jgi:Ca2+-dependent lipid-binding protein
MQFLLLKESWLMQKRLISKSKTKILTYSRYQLRVFVSKAKDLPPADSEGASDPFVAINCAGKKGKTTTRDMTLNPSWYETVALDVELPNLEKEVIDV